MGETVAFTITNCLARYRTGLVAACKRDMFGLTYADLNAGLESGAYIAVDVGRQGVVIFEIRTVDEQRALSIAAMTGKGLNDWLPALLDFIEKLARDQGCAKILAWGRPGWKRALRGHGYRPRVVGLIREVAA